MAVYNGGKIGFIYCPPELSWPMIGSNKIEKLTAEYKKRLEALDAKGDLDIERGLRALEDTLLAESQESQKSILKSIGKLEGKKKPVTNAELVAATLEHEKEQ